MTAPKCEINFEPGDLLFTTRDYIHTFNDIANLVGSLFTGDAIFYLGDKPNWSGNADRRGLSSQYRKVCTHFGSVYVSLNDLMIVVSE